MVRTRLKYGAGVAAMGVAVTLFAAAPAQAATYTWQRSCGTHYTAGIDAGKAWTTKGRDGSCAGHAWVKIKTNDRWSDWSDNSLAAYHFSSTPVQASQHKGCADCTVYTLYRV